MQDCNNSIANALELLQSCAKAIDMVYKQSHIISCSLGLTPSLFFFHDNTTKMYGIQIYMYIYVYVYTHVYALSVRAIQHCKEWTIINQRYNVTSCLIGWAYSQNDPEMPNTVSQVNEIMTHQVCQSYASWKLFILKINDFRLKRKLSL